MKKNKKIIIIDRNLIFLPKPDLFFKSKRRKANGK